MADPLDLTAYLLQNPLYQYGGQIRQQGSQTTPVYSPMEGLARALQGGVGGFFQGQAMRDAQSERGEDQATLERAMKLYQTDPMGARNLLAGRPNLAGISSQLLLSDVAAQKQLDVAKGMRDLNVQSGQGLLKALGIGGEAATGGTGVNQPSGAAGAPSGATPSIQPDLQNSINGLSAEYKQLTGKDLNITSGARSPQQQAQLFANRGTNPYPVAPPGTSMHEKGGAIDVDPATADYLDKSGLLKKYGLHRPYANDPVHIEPIPQQGGQSQAQGPPQQTGMPLPAGFTSIKGHPADQALLNTGVALLKSGHLKEGQDALMKAFEKGADWSTKVAEGLPTERVRDKEGNEHLVPRSQAAGQTSYREMPLPGSTEGDVNILEKGAKDPEFQKTPEYAAAYARQAAPKQSQSGQLLSITPPYPAPPAANPTGASPGKNFQTQDTPSSQLEMTTKLATEFNKIPEVQKYKAMAPMLEVMRNAEPGRAGDMNFLQAYARVLSPGSERFPPPEMIKQLSEVGSLPEDVRKIVRGVMTGGGMTGEERGRIMKEVENRLGAYKSTHDTAAKIYSDWAKELGLNPDRILQSPVLPEATAAARPEGSATHILRPDGTVGALK